MEPWVLMSLLLCHVIMALALLISAQGSSWILQVVYRPYGPMMCAEMCRDSVSSSPSIQDFYCHRISKDHVSDGSLLCLETLALTKRRDALAFKNPGEQCMSENRGGNKSHIQTGWIHKKYQRLIRTNPQAALQKGCKSGQLCVVKYIMSKGLADINCRLTHGRTPAMVAARNGRAEVFDFLVSEGSDLLARDAYNDTLLHLSCKGGNTQIVQKLLTHPNLELDSKGWRGWTPVMYTIKYNHSDVFNLLVDKSCKLTTADNERLTLLHIACAAGNVNMIKFILRETEIPIDVADSEGNTSLMVAGECGHLPAFKLLIERGSSATAVNDRGYNVLHIACVVGNVHIVRYILLKKLVPLESKAFKQRTSVLLTAESGHREIVDLLLDKNCDIEAVDDEGNNILHMACIGGNADMVSCILNMKLFSTDVRNRFGRNAMMQAVICNKKKVTDLLIREGCSYKKVDNKGNNIFHLACVTGHLDMVKFILGRVFINKESKNMFGRTPLMLAAMNGHGKVFDFLSTEGCNLNVVDRKGNNLLHAACIGGNADSVAFILSKKVFSIKSRDELGRTPLLLAVANAHITVVDLLVRKGSRLDSVDNNGNTVFHVACKGGHVDMVKYLLLLKAAGVKQKNMRGVTPLAMAKLMGHADIVTVLNRSP